MDSESFENVKEISLRLLIERLVWTDDRVPDWSLELREIEGLGRISTAGDFELNLTGLGTVTEDERKLAFELVVPNVRDLADLDGSHGFRLELAAQSFDAATADILLRTGHALEKRFGSELQRFSVRLSKKPAEETEVFVSVDGTDLRVRGPRTAPTLLDLDS